MIRRGIAKLAAWNTPFDPLVHATDDVFKVEKATISETRIDQIISTTVVVTVKNPGLLWLANQTIQYYVFWEQRPSDPEPRQLARGRLQALPTALTNITVDLEFLCLPPTEDLVLKAEANTWRVGEIEYDPDAPVEERAAAEVYDPLFYSPDASDDPTNVLLGTLDVYRWNPVTLGIERTHLYEGDQIYEIKTGEWASEDLNFDIPPRETTHSRIVATWTQRAVRNQTAPFMSTVKVSSYNWQALIDSSPKPGDAIGTSDGWSINYWDIQNVEPMMPVTYGHMSPSLFPGVSNKKVKMQPRELTITAGARYDYEQEREESLDIYAAIGIQPVLRDARIETVEEIDLSSLTIDVYTREWTSLHPVTLEPMEYKVGDRVQANGYAFICLIDHTATEQWTPWLRDPITGELETVLWQRTRKQAAISSRDSRFFDSNRGKRTARCALRRLERVIVERAMCARLRFTVRASQVREISCRDSVRVINRKLPGGWVLGKVIGREWTIGGNDGTIEIAIPIGTGEAPADVEGKDQTGSIYYTLTGPAVNEPVDAYQLPGMPPRVMVIENDAGQQESAAHGAVLLGEDPVAAIQNMPTAIRVYFEPLRSEDIMIRRMTAQTLPITIPKGIDLTPEIP